MLMHDDEISELSDKVKALEGENERIKDKIAAYFYELDCKDCAIEHRCNGVCSATVNEWLKGE